MHLTSNSEPIIRVDGELQILSHVEITEAELLDELTEVLPETLQQQLKSKPSVEIDHTIFFPNLGRFRTNIFRQAQGLSVALRYIPSTLKSLAELNMPQVLSKLCTLKSGLILVTGSAGSGKSTTLAAMLDYINTTRHCHIITIEDPIEFEHTNKCSLIQQRELHRHTTSWSTALKAALRQDPNVILIGELRDLATIKLALTAAETGHLVMSTLHTAGAVKTINRIIDVFSDNAKELIRIQLADSLQAVISQKLVKKKLGGRMAIQEILVCNDAIRNLIRSNNMAQVITMMQIGKDSGMRTYEQAFSEAVETFTL